ncbi:type II toxin-antitoxin system VapC family toxin [Salmonirosea aquatica]|uniref:PIN domain-containing protein n=1 Tax=Salmonirosea aquatica TaxID=2654236 RepID=A0A7C9BEY8_9BACT|nr:PIN domain-containing protein [Cytophagaceae bacterium SJW1-29]
MLLIDSNIIIDHLRGRTQVTNFIQTMGKVNLAISVIVEMELYNGVLNTAELGKIKRDLSGYLSIPLDKNIGDLALALSEKFALSHHMSVADTLIAATALVYDLELRTYNLKDFRFIPHLKVSNSLA